MVYDIGILVMCQGIWYVFCRQFIEDIKKRSWIITFLSCVFLSLYGIMGMYTFAKTNFDMNELISVNTINDHIFPHRMFASYMIADLVIGVVEYPDQFGLVTGWIHHTMYLTACLMFMYSKYSGLMCLCYSMEIPTIILAMCKFFPKIDVLKSVFTIVFFILRICIFSILMIRCVLYGTDIKVMILLFLSICLNIYWFLKMLPSRNKYVYRKCQSV